MNPDDLTYKPTESRQVRTSDTFGEFVVELQPIEGAFKDRRFYKLCVLMNLSVVYQCTYGRHRRKQFLYPKQLSQITW
jgi:hypothetical protein